MIVMGCLDFRMIRAQLAIEGESGLVNCFTCLIDPFVGVITRKRAKPEYGKVKD
jgi:hypothetical protein